MIFLVVKCSDQEGLHQRLRDTIEYQKLSNKSKDVPSNYIKLLVTTSVLLYQQFQCTLKYISFQYNIQSTYTYSILLKVTVSGGREECQEEVRESLAFNAGMTSPGLVTLRH